jgi:hypothetical protein
MCPMFWQLQYYQILFLKSNSGHPIESSETVTYLVREEGGGEENPPGEKQLRKNMRTRWIYVDTVEALSRLSPPWLTLGIYL